MAMSERQLPGEGSEVFEQKVEARINSMQQATGNTDIRLEVEKQIQEEILIEAVTHEEREKKLISLLEKPLDATVNDWIRSRSSKGGKYNREITEDEYQKELEDLAARNQKDKERERRRISKRKKPKVRTTQSDPALIQETKVIPPNDNERKEINLTSTKPDNTSEEDAQDIIPSNGEKITHEEAPAPTDNTNQEPGLIEPEQENPSDVFSVEIDGKQVQIGGKKENWLRFLEGRRRYSPLFPDKTENEEFFIPEGITAIIRSKQYDNEKSSFYIVGADGIKISQDWEISVSSIVLLTDRKIWEELPVLQGYEDHRGEWKRVDLDGKSEWLPFGTFSKASAPADVEIEPILPIETENNLTLTDETFPETPTPETEPTAPASDPPLPIVEPEASSRIRTVVNGIRKMFERPSKKTVVGIIGGALAIVTIFAIAKNCDSGPAVDYEGPPNSNGETGTSTETNIVPREKRLLDLDDIFRKQGTEAWLKAAGFTYESIELSARQPEEELHNGSTVATGFQVEAKGLSVNYPAGLTTDQPVNGNCVKPDLDNPSQVCTNVETFTGKATLYVDIQNWSQLAPKK